MKRSTVAVAIIAFAAAATASALAASPTITWSRKDMGTAMKGLGYPKPHARKLVCKGASTATSFHCVATYRHHRHRRFVAGGIALGGWLCAGKTLTACKPLQRGFVTTGQFARVDSGSLQGAAEFAARGYMDVKYGIKIPYRYGPCIGSAATWTCGFYATDTTIANVTIALKQAKGGYATIASVTLTAP